MASAVEETTQSTRYREVRKVTLVGSVLDLLLGVVKILVGWVAHSQALIADGLHSLSDLGTDLVVLYAAKHSHREADEDHPYGHGRIETIATVGLGITLTLVAIGIAYEAMLRLNQPELQARPGIAALIVAIISVISKEAIYHYTMRTAKRLRSNMLIANAWHSRSDAISSIVVVIGVAGTMMGYPYLDAVAAIAVAVMIAKIGFDLVRSSARELIDTALEPEVVESIRSEVFKVDGVRALHMLRSRRSGSAALVDLHLQVDPRVSVSEGHQIGDTVRRRLISRIEEVTDVTVHIDPEDDEEESTCDKLPLRSGMIQRLQEQWEGLVKVDPAQITLHYLGGELQIDLSLPLDVLEEHPDSKQWIGSIQRAAKQLPEVGVVRVSFTP
ncbi:MAG: cation diffusion facilitator family transporter [Thiogranum sp.]|nr:cation diffusion facilitator family transporter [Thiogranum sp.]